MKSFKIKFSRILPPVLLVFLFTGCGIAYEVNREKLLKSASVSDWGAPPPSWHWEVEEKWILNTLKDPNSAIFRHGTVEKDAIIGGGGSAQLAWVSSLYVNAKNSYGGYVGDTLYQFAWKNERLVAVKENKYLQWELLK